MDAEQIASLTRSNSGEPYESTGGSFKNAISKLRTLELINRGSQMQLADVFRE